jgi:hypothetical protein
MSDQAVFWLGFKVFAWKRFVTFIQWLLAGSIFFNLMKKKHKRAFHARLVKLRDQTQNVVVPPVVKFRKVIGYGALFVSVVAAGLAGVLHLFFTQNGKPVPFWPTFFPFALLLSILAVIVGEIVIVVSFFWSGLRGFQRYAPPVLAWLFDYRTFDRNVTILVFVVLTAVTALQILLS